MADSKLWEELFVQHKVAQNIIEIASKDNGEDLELPGYGRINLTAKKTSALGENYMSDAYALRVKLEEGRELASFIKVLPANPILREAAYLSKVYHREIGAYRDLIPKMLSLQREAGIDFEQVPISIPAAYYVNLEDVVKGVNDGSGITLVLEDLKTSGYKNTDKRIGCDYEHARLTLQALANYHANSIAFVNKYRQGNELSKDFPPELAFLSEKTFFEEKASEMVRAITPLHTSILRAHKLEYAADWVEQTLLPKLESIVNMSESFEDCGLLVAILHGDTWINNIMFQYEDDRVRAAKLVDWQIVRFGHPAADIMYYIFTSTTHDVRREHMEQLLQDYYETLKKGLSLYDFHIEDQGYSFEKFRAETERRYLWGMFMAFMILPMILDMKVVNKLQEYENEETKDLADADPEKMMAESEERFRELYTSDFLLQNEMLCKRVTEMVAEVYKVVCK